MPTMPVAVVTGGTRGIGREVAERLAGAGYRTVALARRSPPEAITGVEVLVADVTDPAGVEEAFGAIGPVDVLVNNAGVASSNRVGRTSLEQWEASHAVNATGPFLCIRAVFDAMVERGRGHIVTVASTAGLEASRYTSAYTASKHAVVGLMKVVAAEAEGTGVCVGWVCPTFVRTEMTADTIANIAATTGADLATAEARLTALTPHGRILEPAEVAEAVLDLVAGADNGRQVVLDGSPAEAGGGRTT